MIDTEKVNVGDFYKSQYGEEVVCVGASVGNQLAFVYDSNNRQMFLIAFLQKRPFWGRVVRAIGYIFQNMWAKNGDYDFFLLEKEDIPRLRGLLKTMELDN